MALIHRSTHRWVAFFLFFRKEEKKIKIGFGLKTIDSSISQPYAELNIFTRKSPNLHRNIKIDP